MLMREKRWRTHVTIAGDDARIGMAEADLRIREDCNLPRKLFAMPDIILVTEGEEISFASAGGDRFPQSASEVPMHADSDIKLNDTDSAIYKALDQRSRDWIQRAVRARQDFDVPMTLPDKRLQLSG
jgi:hypothetical protein